MKQENSAGVVIFYYNEKEKQPYFLLLKYPTYWGFAKGWIEQAESAEETSIREAKEEAGLKVELIEGFKEQQNWFYRSYEDKKLIRKSSIYFLAEISKQQSKEVKVSEEHEDFIFITLEDSEKYVRIKANKELLKKAYYFIKEIKKQRKLF